jgi:hypothetical protein
MTTEVLIGEPSGLPEVHEAWSAVMGDVTFLGKDSRNTQQGFNYRGIDALMNLVGPVLRKHGVTILPFATRIDRRDFVTAKGTTMRETVVEVGYRIIGPAGDSIEGSAFGEASDAGDKSTPKAMSVAYRSFLLQALCLPTDEPDPDSEVHDRGTATPEAEMAATTAAGLLAGDKTAEQVVNVRTWAVTKGIMDQPVNDAEGNSMSLERLFDKVQAGLGDTSADEAAEQVLKDSLGATPVEETPAEEPVAEGEQA